MENFFIEERLIPLTGYTHIVVKKEAFEIQFLTLGAAIYAIYVPDREGTKRLITVAPEDIQTYCLPSIYHGKSIGRNSGRIKNAHFALDGKEAFLDKNNKGVDTLHGGKDGISTRNFSYKLKETDTSLSIIFTYISPDQEAGFFGTIHIQVTYLIDKATNRVSIIYDATTDQKTLLNMTNHVYFNASGDLRRTVATQNLYLNANRYGVLDERLNTIAIAPVHPVMDFQHAHPVGLYSEDSSLQMHPAKGYDHPFFFNPANSNPIKAALSDSESGIQIEVETTYPTVVIYSNNYPLDCRLLGNRTDEKYLGICMECQYAPDAIHQDIEHAGIFSKEKPYHEEIHFRFLTK